MLRLHRFLPSTKAEGPGDRASLDRLIEEERANVDRDPGRVAKFWSEKMAEAGVERRGHHRLAAKGHTSDEELTAALSDLDGSREAAERELETARARRETLQAPERDRDVLLEPYSGAVGEALEELAQEERHRVYKPLRL